jgi:hypothetical protein
MQQGAQDMIGLLLLDVSHIKKIEKF